MDTFLPTYRPLAPPGPPQAIKYTAIRDTGSAHHRDPPPSPVPTHAGPDRRSAHVGCRRVRRTAGALPASACLVQAQPEPPLERTPPPRRGRRSNLDRRSGPATRPKRQPHPTRRILDPPSRLTSLPSRACTGASLTTGSNDEANTHSAACAWSAAHGGSCREPFVTLRDPFGCRSRHDSGRIRRVSRRAARHRGSARVRNRRYD